MVSGDAAESRSTAPAPDFDDAEVDIMLAALSDPDIEGLDRFRETMLAHPDGQVRAIYAMSPACGDHLDELAGDNDPVVRSTVAQRWDHPINEKLLDDPHPLVALAVARRLDISDEDRARLMARPDVARIAEIVLI